MDRPGYDVGAYLDAVAELAGCAHECVSTVARDMAATWEARRQRQHAEWQASLEEFTAEQETTWEVALRHAGFNTYAAQAVLGKLKAPTTGVGGKQDDLPGLARFVGMSHAERVTCFAPILGGERVLSRVSATLAMRWS